MAEPLLEARGIVKSFGRVRALRGASFTVNPGEVVALIGDNGAGKTTLVKTLSGVIHPDDGEIRFEGQPVTIASPTAARELGIETVYQDLALAPDLESSANLFLGREAVRPGLLGKLGFLDKGAMRRRTEEAFKTLGVVQTRAVLDLIRRVRDTGLAVVLISHNMPEVMEVSDRVEVLRLGERVARFTTAETSMEELVGAMTGALRHEEEPS
jgi:simple sugar transport system ATP-binding protein